MITKEEAREKIKELIAKFEVQKEYFKTLEYNETQTRKDFIDPFFRALGWDIDNKKGKLESYRDVKLEDKIKVSGRTKSPDYAFNVHGKRIFFVEAKKPAVPIKDQPEPAIQVRNYAWNANLLISVVTDFEEFAIYDCTRKPRKHDRAITKRLKYLHYTQYLKEFDFLWDTFAFENVEKGSITQYGQKYTDLKNAEPVDKAFLKSLEDWRTYLATNIAQLNKNLQEYELNFAVQQIIDRIVFLKVCEDRLLEKEGSLIAQIRKGNYYQNLYQYFAIADQKYNSGLFDLKKDAITANLVIDNKVIKSIIEELYGEDENGITFNFNIIPVEILGYAYEQFLGKVIYLTSANSAKIEEKPEVRKAGGVYYTPQYIVDYIVKETLGRLIEGKTPQEISTIKILDPACGSGSFLLGAYQYLLDYHLNYYNQYYPNGKNPKNSPLTPEGKLTTAEKKRILLNNIFGVDIDSQAVEVTKLSLLLKALEGETEASIHASLKLFNERVLPSIDENIQCGNSLIGTDFYDSGLFLTPQEERKINVFDWKIAFKEVFRQGGFDVVIGNPPYVLLQSLEQRMIFDYALKNFVSAKYKIDMYQLFLEQTLKLLKNSGLLGYIIPNTFLKNIHSEPIRKLLLENTKIKQINLLNYRVFEQASVDTCLLIYEKSEGNLENEIIINQANQQFDLQFFVKITQRNLLQNPRYDFNIFIKEDEHLILRKMNSKAKPLSNYCGAYFGIQTFDRAKYVSTKQKNKNYKPVIDGGNIERYYLKPPTEFVYFVPEAIKSGGQEKHYLQDRICIRQIGKFPIATFVKSGIFALNTVYNVYLTSPTNLKFILGIINSKICTFFWQKINYDAKTTFPKIKKEAILSIPIPNIDFENPTEKRAHDEIVKFVEMLLELNKRLHKATLPSDIRQLQARIQAAERQLDQLVYRLYDLTSEEIKLIDPDAELSL
jgi:type I restriction-modification system DNA methylase subunit